MVYVFKEEKNLAAASSQPVSARVGVWRGRRRGQGDRGGRLHRVVHGQDQAGAPDGHVVFRRGQVALQAFIEQAGGGALAVLGAWAAGVRADGDVCVHGADAGVVQDEVRILVVELTFVLRREDGGRKCRSHQ